MTPTGTLNALIRAGLAAGKSYAQIGAETGWSRSAIFRRAKRLGLVSSNVGGGPKANPGGRPKVELPKSKLATIRERLEAGDSFTVIARLVGISRPTVAKLIREHGLHLEPTAERLEAMFAGGMRSREIALRTGLPVEEVVQRRKEWTVQRQREICLEREEAKRGVPEPVATPAAEPGGDKLSRALCRHMRPLGSLPDRVAALGVPVLVRRAA